jgi:phosphoserine phosphatase
MNNKILVSLIFLLGLIIFGCNAEQNNKTEKDPLPSWNDGPAKQSIVDFVKKITDPASPGYVPPTERIATFDNDGTLWSEQPAYFQLLFAIDRVKALAPQHPEWKTKQPFKAVLDNDMKALAASGEHGLVELIMATHAPMLELLAYLRANEFKTFIVSGGGIEFMRPWVEEVYGILPEQVVGSVIKTKFEMRDGQHVLSRMPEVDFIDDKAGKPIGIHKFIGRRPIAAFGNSDGDLQMLQWTAAGDGPSFMAYIHHTDADREWAYDRESHIGRLDTGLDEAKEKGWTVVDMKKDWKVIYPFEIEK